MTQQTEQLMLIQTLLAQSQAQMMAAQNQNQAMMTHDPSTLAKGGAATNNVMVGPVDPSCPGGDVSGYANGQIPVSLLRPLVNYPQHHLRADAAKAFNDMSMAYALQFGNTICVTDSYRSLSEQVSVKASKRPGRHPRHVAPRPGRGRRPLRWHPGLRHPPARVDAADAPKFGWCDPMRARSGGSSRAVALAVHGPRAPIPRPTGPKGSGMSGCGYVPTLRTACRCHTGHRLVLAARRARQPA